jgi:hypothetical protein
MGLITNGIKEIEKRSLKGGILEFSQIYIWQDVFLASFQSINL